MGHVGHCIAVPQRGMAGRRQCMDTGPLPPCRHPHHRVSAPFVLTLPALPPLPVFNQAMMNRLLEPPPFLLAEQYASALTTLGVAVCWMPVLPISPFIAITALLLHYWADKVVALRWAALCERVVVGGGKKAEEKGL